MSTTTQEGQVGAARGAAPRAPLGGVVAGVVLVAAGLGLLPEAFDGVELDATFIGGPRLAPIVVSVGWLAIAATYLVHQVIAWRVAVTAIKKQLVVDGQIPDEQRVGVQGTDTASSDAVSTDAEGAEGQAPAEPDDLGSGRRRWLTPVLLIGTLLAYILLLEPLGFVLATASFFVAAARILRSNHLRRDIAVAIPLALGVYLGFTRFLEINLPEGVLPL